MKNPNNNFYESDKQKVFQRFVESDESFIERFFAKEFIDWNEYIDIDKFRDLRIKEIEGLVEHLKRNNNLSINFIEKIFCSLEKLLNADEYKNGYQNYEANRIKRIFDNNLFEKMVRYQDNIDLPKIFVFNQEIPEDGIGVSNINANNVRFSDDIIENFLGFLYKRKENEDVNRLLRNRYFSRLIFQRFNFPIDEVLDFYEPWRGTNRLLQFPSKYISELIKFASNSMNEKDKRNLAYEILMKKVNLRCELINEFSAKEICENFVYIKSKTLNSLSKENFNKLIDQFLSIRQISFDALKKILDCDANKLMHFIEPNKFFDLIRYSQIDNNLQQEFLKKYFVDFFNKPIINFWGIKGKISENWRNKFFNYIVSQNFGTVTWVLNIFPQVVNYLSIEQIYDNFNDITKRGLINKDFLEFNELLNTLYKKKDKEKIKILPKILENNATLINDVNNNEMLINLMLKNKNEINEKLLNVVAKNINGIRFSQLIRWGKNNYSIDKMPENVKLIFFNFISKIDYTKFEFYNFDFESRVFMLNFYLNCIKNRDERFQNMSKKLLLKSKHEYLLKTINYVKNNSEENNFVNVLKEVIFQNLQNYR